MTGHCIAFTPESPEVKRLIRRAVLFLQKQPDDNPGEAALTAYSLMKAGEPVQHPKVRYAVDECLEICSTPEKVSALLDIYETCVVAIFLCELDAVKHRPQIQKWNFAWLQEIH